MSNDLGVKSLNLNAACILIFISCLFSFVATSKGQSTGGKKAKEYLIIQEDSIKLLNEYGKIINPIQNAKVAIAFSQDTKFMATSFGGKDIIIWDLESGFLLPFILKEHNDIINSLIFHPTEPYLISIAQDGRICFWDITQFINFRINEMYEEPAHKIVKPWGFQKSPIGPLSMLTFVKVRTINIRPPNNEVEIDKYFLLTANQQEAILVEIEFSPEIKPQVSYLNSDLNGNIHSIAASQETPNFLIGGENYIEVWGFEFEKGTDIFRDRKFAFRQKKLSAHENAIIYLTFLDGTSLFLSGGKDNNFNIWNTNPFRKEKNRSWRNGIKQIVAQQYDRAIVTIQL